MDDINTIRKPARLWNRDFFLLWQGQIVSQTGQRAFGLAMLFFIKETTGSASLMGLMMMISSLPGVLLGPLGGTFADNFSRKKIIVFGDLLNGFFVLSLAILMIFVFYARGQMAVTFPPTEFTLFFLTYIEPHANFIMIAWLFIVAAAGAIIFAFFTPAVTAAVPDIVPDNKLDAANSLNQFAIFISLFVGQGLGGLLYTITGAGALFLINGFTYLFASGAEAFIKIPQVIPEQTKKGSVAFRAFISDTKEGLFYVWNQKGMRILFLVAALLYLFIAPMALLLPFYVEDYLKLDAAWYGYLLMSLGVGSVIGYLIAGSITTRGRTQSNLTIGSLVTASMALGFIGIVQIPPVVLVVIFLVGLSAGIFMVKATTILQMAASSEIRGRVFGLLGTLTSGLAPLGMGIGGVIADLANKNIPAIYAVCGILVFILSIAMAFSKEARDFLMLGPKNDTAD
jgi:DHA3 family macrolide efflux protein-like MFS transporter